VHAKKGWGPGFLAISVDEIYGISAKKNLRMFKNIDEISIQYNSSCRTVAL
jgi:hypothetical protein